MTSGLVARRVASVVILAFALAACSTGTAGTNAPAATPAATAITSASPAPSAVLSASPSAAQALIPDGTYSTASVPVSVSLAKIRAAKDLTAAQRAELLADFSAHTSQIVRIRLQGGQFTESDAFDGGAFNVGADGSYVFPDDRTLLLQEQCCGVTNFEVTPGGSGFSLRIRSQTAPNAEDGLLGVMVYENAPFVAVH
jgi:hypothetical protein